MKMMTSMLSLVTAVLSVQVVHAQAITSPPIVISSDAHIGTVWAQDRVGAPAINGAVSLQSPSSGGTAAAAVNTTSGNLNLNANAVAQPSSIVVQGNVPCPSIARSWTGVDGVSVCNATPPLTPNGGSASVTDSTAPTTGSAVLACSGGTWSVSGTPSCQTSCSAGVQSWVGSATCAASFPALLAGQSATLASTNGNTGSAQFSCNAAGAWQLTANGGCTAPSRACIWPNATWRATSTRQVQTGARESYTTGPVGALPSGAVVGHGGYSTFGYNSAHRGVRWDLQYYCSNGTLTKVAMFFNGANYGNVDSIPGVQFYDWPGSIAGLPHVSTSSHMGPLYVSVPRSIYSPY